MRIHAEMLGEHLEVSESFRQGPVESLLGKGPFGPAGKSKDASGPSKLGIRLVKRDRLVKGDKPIIFSPTPWLVGALLEFFIQ